MSEVWKNNYYGQSQATDRGQWRKIDSDSLEGACMVMQWQVKMEEDCQRHFERRCMHALRRTMHACSMQWQVKVEEEPQWQFGSHGQCDKWSWKRIVKEGQGLSVTIKWAWIEISSYMYDRRLPVGMQVSMDKVFFKQLSRLSVMTPPPTPTPPLPELTYIVIMWSETDVCLPPPPPPLTLSVLELCKAKCLPSRPPPPTPLHPHLTSA